MINQSREPVGSVEYVWYAVETNELFCFHQKPEPGQEDEPHSMFMGEEDTPFTIETFIYIGAL